MQKSAYKIDIFDKYDPRNWIYPNTKNVDCGEDLHSESLSHVTIIESKRLWSPSALYDNESEWGPKSKQEGYIQTCIVENILS